MRDKIMELIGYYQIKESKESNDAKAEVYRSVVNDLYTLLAPSETGATITLNGVTVEVYAK